MDEKGKNEGGRRRERGIFERPKDSGIWWVVYFDENGRKHREKVGPKSLALKVYRKRKNEIAERRFFPESIRRREVLLSAMIDDYLEQVKGKRLYREAERYGRFWSRALKGKTLRQITPGDIERYRNKRLVGEALLPVKKQGSKETTLEKAKPASIATVNRELAFLKHLFNVAITDGKAEANPVRSVKLLEENNTRVRFLDDSEEGRLRQAIGEDEWPKVAVAINTGLRQAEQFRLRWENVDFANGVLTVPRSKHGRKRHVPMNDTVREILRNLPSRLKSEWVFPSVTDESPLDARNYVNRVFLPALKSAKIYGLRWHDLRHTFASRLVMAGVDLRTVQELMGHETLEMTMRYAHLSPGHRLEAVQRLNPKPTDTTTDTGKSEVTVTAGTAVQAIVPSKESEAARRIRTGDLLITNQLLYQLS